MNKFINKVIQGDCLIKLKELEDNSVDSIVTDPPYHLVSIVKRFGKEGSAPAQFGTDGAFSRASKGFMGKTWDGLGEDGIGIANNQEMWAECLRVLKPGGHLLAFSGTRTYHRMASAIEDAGFEVRDMIEWVYGSGFPKSLNIGKAVDKLGGRCLGQEIGNIIKQKRIELGYSTIKLAEIGGFYGNTNHGGTVSNWETGNGSITPEQFNKLIDILGLENEPVIANKRKLLGKQTTLDGFIFDGLDGKTIGKKEIDITKGTSEWEGWGTALKPAHEPICMARKPLAEKTVAENCLKYGTGGINIDESRVGIEEMKARPSGKSSRAYQSEETTTAGGMGEDKIGRFPANLIHDNSEEVRECFPENIKGEIGRAGRKSGGNYEASSYKVGVVTETGFKDNGNASRFFKSIIYQAKASKSERNAGLDVIEDKNKRPQGEAFGDGSAITEHSERKGNFHPTVKPIALMEYLIKMVTKPGGIVLDPFAGSGSTLVAAKQNGYQYIGIEMTEEYIPIIEARLSTNKD